MRLILLFSPLLFLLNAQLRAEEGFTVQKSLSSGSLPQGARAAATELSSGVRTNLAFDQGPGLYTGAHKITVPPGANKLEIVLRPFFADIDLFVRFNRDVELSTGFALSDYQSRWLGSGVIENVTIMFPAPGEYYIAYGVITNGNPTLGDITATITMIPGCATTLMPTSGISMPARASTATATLYTATNCSWQMTSDSPWLTFDTPTGTGSGAPVMRATTNTGPERMARVRASSTPSSIGSLSQILGVTQASGIPTPLPDNALIVSQFVAGGGQWSTAIYVTNLGNTAEGYTIRFYDDSGLPVAVPIVNFEEPQMSLSGTLLAGATRRFETAPSPTLQVAWAAIVPQTSGPNKLSGFAVFRQQATPLSSEAVVGIASQRNPKQFLLYDVTQGFETGIAIANTDALNPASIDIEIRNDGGAVIGTDRIELPPFGHTSFEISKRFPATAGGRGSIRLFAGSTPIAGLGLRFSGVQFTSFPLVTSPDAR